MLQMSYDDPYSVIDLVLASVKGWAISLVSGPSLARSPAHAEVKSARCIINVAGPYMLTQGELMSLVNAWGEMQP